MCCKFRQGNCFRKILVKMRNSLLPCIGLYLLKNNRYFWFMPICCYIAIKKCEKRSYTAIQFSVQRKNKNASSMLQSKQIVSYINQILKSAIGRLHTLLFVLYQMVSCDNCKVSFKKMVWDAVYQADLLHTSIDMPNAKKCLLDWVLMLKMRGEDYMSRRRGGIVKKT